MPIVASGGTPGAREKRPLLRQLERQVSRAAEARRAAHKVPRAPKS
ncbi:MAG: hypothetical protein K6U04_10330 [Armatimonadetes bacterium]|nr:hypothetical protein [Armatimonadota bacterium]